MGDANALGVAIKTALERGLMPRESKTLTARKTLA